MSENLPTVSVVMLSYNRPELLREALASVCAQTYAPLDVTVIDNHSPRSAEIARVVAQYGDVKLIRHAVNLGYAGGMNRGIKAASGRYTLLTEDDITLDADCVRRLVEFADTQPEAGLTAPLIYNRAARTIRCAGGELSLGGVYLRYTHGEGQRDAGQYAQPFDVTYVDGACLFARTDLLQALGGFRAEFFMYVEAVELCVRVARAGRRLTVVPAAKVSHFEPPAVSTPTRGLEFHKYKNLFSLYLLHARARHLPEFFARYAVLGLLRSLTGKGGDTRSLLGALWWVTRRTPSLLRERHADASQRVTGSGGALDARERAMLSTESAPLRQFNVD